MRIFPIGSLTLLIAAFSASTAQAGFDCSASGGRLTVLGKTLEPVAVASPGDCSADSRSLSGAAAGLPAPLSTQTIRAATDVLSAQKTVVASGGVADLAIGTPSLPIDLTKVPVGLIDTIRGALPAVSLAPVKSAIPALPTNLVTNTPTLTVPLIGQLDPLSGVLVTIFNIEAVKAAYAEENARIIDQNAANLATNTANAAVNALTASIPDAVALDDTLLATLLNAAKLPTVDLLRVRSAMAYAAGACQGASPVVSGSSKLAGLTVLGEELSLDQVLTLTRTLTNSIDPAKIVLTTASLGLTEQQSQLIAAAVPGALKNVVDTANATLQAALSGLGEVKVPLGVADIRIAPGAQVKTADSVTQQALTVLVTVAGQKIVEAIVGEATVSAAGVDCAEPVIDPQTPTGATLGCSTRNLVLVDVLERGGRVKLFGFADPALAGRTVNIVFNATGRRVAGARIAKDGSFDTTAPLPPARLRDSNAARYMATLGEEESINLKLRRRMVLSSMTSSDGRVTIAGRVVRPLSSPLRAITLTRRVSCTQEKVVTRFKPRSDGTFRVTVRAPRGVGTAVYRMTTLVPSSATGTGLFETYTLPRAVDIDR